ncbi:hypothetical protein ACFE04_013078 [Oxalis oulophora]
MSKKTIVSVELLCSKCRRKVMKLVATLEGITSIVLDPAKCTVTVIGEADPVDIIEKIRKFRKSATVVSVGPAKSEEKKDDLKKDNMYVPYAPKNVHQGSCLIYLSINQSSMANVNYLAIPLPEKPQDVYKVYSNNHSGAEFLCRSTANILLFTPESRLTEYEERNFFTLKS